LEAYSSDPATVARYLGREYVGRETSTAVMASGLTVSDLCRMAREGDGRARDAIAITGRYLGTGLAGVINALNPARIIVGGQITGAWDLLEPLIRSGIRERALTAEAAETPVGVDPDHAETRLRGAGALVVAPVFAAPEIA
jgi:predicted NBD/HSP70 family sugar kinase